MHRSSKAANGRPNDGRKTCLAIQRTLVCLQLKGSPSRSYRHHLSLSYWESQKSERKKLLLWFKENDADALLGGGGGGGFGLPVVVLEVWAENLSRAVPYDLTPALLT